MPHTPSQKQALRISRAAAGLCLCGRDRRPGRKQCQFCADQYKARQRNRRDIGLCACGKQPELGYKVCRMCLDAIRVRRHAAIANGLCAYCNDAPALSGIRFCEQHRTEAKQRRARIRSETIAAYGGSCACCGESEEAFLCIDHVFNDGAQERRTSRRSSIYQRLKNAGYPKDRYQLLCANCNTAKQIKGACPHQVTKPREVSQTPQLQEPDPDPISVAG